MGKISYEYKKSVNLPRTTDQLPPRLGELEVSEVLLEKDLGVPISSNCSWSTHMSETIRKSLSVLHKFKRSSCDLLAPQQKLSSRINGTAHNSTRFATYNVHHSLRTRQIPRRITDIDELYYTERQDQLISYHCPSILIYRDERFVALIYDYTRPVPARLAELCQRR